ncbi:Glutamate--cysteine ligase EgtA [Streptomyces hirsutus]
MECVGTVRADLDAVRAVLREDGLGLVGFGHDPWHTPRRFLREPRYDAMEACLDRTGPAGRAMMCTSASVQVCLDAGYEEPGTLGHVRRWWLARRARRVGRGLANSPLAGHRPTGWLSTRQLRWAQIGTGRAGGPVLDADPRGAWTRHVLDAPVMCIRQDSGPWDVPDGLTFREWTRSGVPRAPTREDLDYHVTTLFPVRPRGHLERMIDAQPGDHGWIVPLAVATALFDDPEASRDGLPRREAARRTDPWHARAAPTRCGRTLPVAAWPTRGLARGGRPLLLGGAAGPARTRCHGRGRGRGGGVPGPLCRPRPLPGRRPARRPARRSRRHTGHAPPQRSRHSQRPRPARARSASAREGHLLMTDPALDAEALRERAVASLITARDRTTLLTSCIDGPDLTAQHSPLMSPLVWYFAA